MMIEFENEFGMPKPVASEALIADVPIPEATTPGMPGFTGYQLDPVTGLPGI